MKRKGINMERSSVKLRQKIVSIGMYCANLAVLFLPWITIGHVHYNLLQLAVRMKASGLESVLSGADIYVEDLHSLAVGIWLEIALFGVFMLLCIAYIVSVMKKGKGRLNGVVTCLTAVLIYFHSYGGNIADICTEGTLSHVYPAILLVISGAEFIISKAMEQWDEMRAESTAMHEKEQKKKEEKKKRLYFKGKYNAFFYRFLWKNFKKTWKDYVLLLMCSSMVFCFIVTGFGLQKMLGTVHGYQGNQLFGGLNAILMNTIIPLGVISVFIIIILSFYYLRCRAKNYGIFLTLVMRKKTLNYFVALEFISLLLVTFLLGGGLGTSILYLFSAKSEELLEVHIAFSNLGILVYLKAIGTILLIYLISFMAARDIFRDFNLGKSMDLRAVKEKLPRRWCKGLFALGIIICVYSVYEYRQLRNFENVYLLLIFMVGYVLILRYGMTMYLLKERKGKHYLKNLMIHNQLFHKSRTSVGYIFALTVILFFALFYFSFQIISVEIAEDGEDLYPYDIMCIADDEDEDIFNKLQDKYETEIYSYPMVRVSNSDSTEKVEGTFDVAAIQGQNIGISESTYHALKKHLDPSYQEKPLGLDDEGESIYIVHQQDKSVKAQPVDFYYTRKQPLLHVGLPCLGVDIYHVKRKDTGYYYKKIQGEEIGSVTGVFRQGLRENLIVFSDKYFENVKEEWKTRDAYSGEPIASLPEQWREDAIIRQGPTKLVLINADQKDLPNIVEDLTELKKRHADEEHYDASVSSFYVKQDALKALKTERTMKLVMNFLLMIAFFLIYVVLEGIRMLTEFDMNQRRAEFLNCMGMHRKERIRLVKRELLRYYYILPTALAVIFSMLYTILVFQARQYQPEDIKNYFESMIPLWGICLLISGVAMWCLTTLYAHKVEVEDGQSRKSFSKL